MSSLGDVFYLVCTKCVYWAVLQHAAICVQCIVVVRSVHCASLAFVFKLAFAFNVFLAIPECSLTYSMMNLLHRSWGNSWALKALRALSMRIVLTARSCTSSSRSSRLWSSRRRSSRRSSTCSWWSARLCETDHILSSLNVANWRVQSKEQSSEWAARYLFNHGRRDVHPQVRVSCLFSGNLGEC